MKRVAILLACALFAVSLSGCHKMFAFGRGIKGSGVAKTETRNVGKFTGLDVGGAFQVELTCQKDLNVELTADDNLLPHIKTEVRDGVLHVENDTPVNFSKSPRLRIAVPEINNLEASGACEVKASDVKTDSLKLNLSGASHLRASGQVHSLKVDVSGASGLEAKELQAENVDAEASGASRVNIYASDTLKAEASGASSVYYYGSPKNVTPHASGASKVGAGS